MSTLGELAIKLGLDTVQFQNGLKKAEYAARQTSERTQTYLKNIEKAANSLNDTNKWARLGFLGGKGLSGAKAFLAYADGYTEIGNRMRLVHSNAIESAQALQSVFDISMRTNQSVNATSEVYQRFAQNAKALGINQSQVASLTETVSKAVAISGASAASAQAALMQFGQSLASGVFRGQEFNSVMEQTPGLAMAIAKGLGVTTGELRQMANDGKLTMDVIIPALEKAKDSVDKDFSTRVLTLSAAFENLRTQATKWVGEANETTGAVRLLSETVGAAAEHFDVLAKGILYIGGGAIAGQLAKTIQMTQQQATAAKVAAMSAQQKAVADKLAAQSTMSLLHAQLELTTVDKERAILHSQIASQKKELIRLTNVETAATQKLTLAKRQANFVTRTFNNALGLVGGGVGVVTGLLTVGAMALYEWYAKTEQAKLENLDFAKSLDVTSEALKRLDNVRLESSIAKTKDAIKEQTLEVSKLKREYDELLRKSKIKGIWAVDDYTGKDIYIDQSGLADANLNKARIKREKLKEAEDQLAKSRKDLIALEIELGNRSYETNGILGQYAQNSDTLRNKTLDAISPIARFTEAMAGLGTQIHLVNQASQGFNPKMLVIRTSEVAKSIAKSQENLKLNTLKGKELAAYKAKLALRDRKVNEGDAGYNEAYNAELQYQISTLNNKHSGPDYVKQYTDQLTEMQNRIAQLRADTSDIKLFGEPSQYQEFSKLQQDITANAEKYAAYGVEGVAKLKEMARQIDSETQKKAIAQFGINNNQQLDAMEFELSLLGKTRKEQDLIQYNHQLDLEAARLKIGMSKENAAQLDEEIAKLKARRAEIERQKALAQSNPLLGLQDGIVKFGEAANNVMANVSQITQNALGGMSDALTDFVLTGKANFNDLAQSIIKDISAMIMKMMVFKALESAFGGTSFGKLLGFSQGGLVGFDNGGFTGLGGKYTPAGIVHKGEYVITKEATSRLGVDYLNFLNYGTRRGFANGGGVAVPKVPMVKAKTQNANVSIKVINNGEPVDAKVTQKQQGEQLQVTVELMRKIAKQEASSMLQTNFRAGGAFA
ncbi:phage tail tape measure protein [Gallibacterium anatis]|uniref:phage tail tape measure protein n=1 Tax=Gallibacterium anatis TaxID=750 RepID=UPI00068A4ACB|nr:phage tail tape measure protein [Gallibacterium anatis]